jgi:signal transduction histidine kinase
VTVGDRGLGISVEDLDRLFTTKSGGMGMGLSICRSIIGPTEGDYGPHATSGLARRFSSRWRRTTPSRHKPRSLARCRARPDSSKLAFFIILLAFSALLEPPAQSPGRQPWCTGPGGPGLTDYGRVPQRKPGCTCQLPSRDLTKP